MFDNVTILFSDVVGFTRICSQISPMEVVSMLNAMYTQFDQLSEKHNVYKVSIYLYPPQTLFVVGYTVFTLSVRASVRASVRPSVRNTLFP